MQCIFTFEIEFSSFVVLMFASQRFPVVFHFLWL